MTDTTTVRVADQYGIATHDLATLAPGIRADYHVATLRLTAIGATHYTDNLVYDTAHGGWVAVLSVDALIATYLLD